MFNYAELNYLISGTGKIDVEDWIKHSKVISDNPLIIEQFWEVVHSLS